MVKPVKPNVSMDGDDWRLESSGTKPMEASGRTLQDAIAAFEKEFDAEVVLPSQFNDFTACTPQQYMTKTGGGASG